MRIGTRFRFRASRFRLQSQYSFSRFRLQRLEAKEGNNSKLRRIGNNSKLRRINVLDCNSRMVNKLSYSFHCIVILRWS